MGYTWTGDPNTAQLQVRVVNDDWQFPFSATNTSGVFVLTGYTPTGNLLGPNGYVQSLSGMYDTSALAAGSFTLTIPRSITGTLTPDDSNYRVQVQLTDPYGLTMTYLIVPLCVKGV